MDICTEGGVYIPKADEIEMGRATARAQKKGRGGRKFDIYIN